MAVQCLEPKFYATFLATMGIAEDARFAAQFDAAQWPAQTEQLAALFDSDPRARARVMGMRNAS